MPSASVSSAAPVKPGFLRSVRNAKRTSWIVFDRRFRMSISLGFSERVGFQRCFNVDYGSYEDSVFRNCPVSRKVVPLPDTVTLRATRVLALSARLALPVIMTIRHQPRASRHVPLLSWKIVFHLQLAS